MRPKLVIRKSRSPPKCNLMHEDDIAEELDNGKQVRPNVFIVNENSRKLTRNGIFQIANMIKRRARSNSPKHISPKNSQNIKEDSNQSPILRKKSPLKVLQNKATNANIPYKTRERSSSRKLSPDSCLRKKYNSPKPECYPENDKLNLLKQLQKRKRQLNKEFLEAVENGNLSKINQFLEWYWLILIIVKGISV